MTDTDPIPPEDEGDQPGRYGFFGTLFGLPTLERNLKEIFMARLDAISSGLDAASTNLTALSDEVGKLGAQIAELQAGSVSQEEIDALALKANTIAGNISSAASSVDALIEPDAGETPPDDGGGTP